MLPTPLNPQEHFLNAILKKLEDIEKHLKSEEPVKEEKKPAPRSKKVTK